jgi:hypothetical protein
VEEVVTAVVTIPAAEPAPRARPAEPESHGDSANCAASPSPALKPATAATLARGCAQRRECFITAATSQVARNRKLHLRITRGSHDEFGTGVETAHLDRGIQLLRKCANDPHSEPWCGA